MSLVEVRELGEADMALLAQPRGSAPVPLARIRERHHAVARLLAQGTGPGEVAAITGFSASRISILQADPTFAELVAFYRQNVNAIYADLHGRMATLSLDVADEIHTRLETEPEAISTPLLIDILKTTADRTGFAPVSRSVNMNVNVDLASRLSMARQRAGLGLPPPSPAREPAA